MRIYKEKNRGVTAKTWTIAISDQYGKRRKFSGFTDKETTRELGRKLERLVAYRKAGRDFDNELERWLEQIPPKLQQRLASFNLLDATKIAAAKPLMVYEKIRNKQASKEIINITGGHLYDFKKHLQAKGCSEKHVRLVLCRCSSFILENKLSLISDIKISVIENWLATKRNSGSSPQTVNHLHAVLKNFCNWMLREDLIKTNPLKRIKKLNAKEGRRRKRRALTENEISLLLQHTKNEGTHHGLTGYERWLVYQIALTTGLRFSEILTLCVSDFDLESNPPSVTVRPENEKAGRGDTLPLQKSLAKELVAYFQNRIISLFDEGRAFSGMWKDCGAAMLRKDLDAAGVNWRPNEKGETVDFHCLRHTFGTMLAASGVHPKVCQELMRHSSIDLTMNLYTHTVLEDRARAAANLPDFSQTKSKPDENTGAAETA